MDRVATDMSEWQMPVSHFTKSLSGGDAKQRTGCLGWREGVRFWVVSMQCGAGDHLLPQMTEGQACGKQGISGALRLQALNV